MVLIENPMHSTIVNGIQHFNVSEYHVQLNLLGLQLERCGKSQIGLLSIRLFKFHFRHMTSDKTILIELETVT